MGYQTTSLGSYWCGWTYACQTLFVVPLYPYLYWWFLCLCPCCIHSCQGCSSTAFLQYGFLGRDLYWSLAHLCSFWLRRGIFGSRPTIVLLIQRYHSSDLCSPHSSACHAERFNCTLLKKAEAMWQHVCLPKSFWQDAVKTSLHIYNHQPIHHLLQFNLLSYCMHLFLIFYRLIPILFIYIFLSVMWRWLTTWPDLDPLCNLWVIPGSSPIVVLTCSYLISNSSYVYHFIPLSSTPYPYDQGYTILPLWWLHIGLTSLIPTSMFSFLLLLYLFMPHVILVEYLRLLRSNKKLYSSSLVVSPSKEHK